MTQVNNLSDVVNTSMYDGKTPREKSLKKEWTKLN